MGKSKKARRPVLESTPPAREAAAVPLTATAAGTGPLGLKILVFWAGAVLMGLEIAGSRVLAPHFGNSVFVWGSLISVFLIALSLGYYLGGRIADRRPARIVLNSICMIVSLWIFGVALVSYAFCAALFQAGLGEQTGPLVASLALFLAPGVGMGMVSPYAIRLAAQSVTSMGQIAGTLYALSTLGSIVGTLLTTFVLVPLIGLSAILKGLGLSLLIVSVFTLPNWRRNALPTLVALVGVGIVVFLLPAHNQAALSPDETLVFEAETPYQHIAVIDNKSRGSREMRFDRYVESMIELRPPYRALADYTDYFHLALLLKPDIERSLFIGAGGAIGPRAFRMHNERMQIDVVDIDPKVLQIAREQFFVKNDPQIRMIAQDGRMFVRTAEQTYDCIVLDAFTIGGRIPFHLVTREFLELCRGRMSADGVFVMNINSALEGPRSPIFRSMHATLSAVFANTYVFAKDHHRANREQSTNIVFVATNDTSRISEEEWLERGEQYESRSFVQREQLLRAVRDLIVGVPDTSEATLFTDDYAPIETMSF